MDNKDTAQKCILLGVTGGIAAYKACEIIRSFQKGGYRVKVVMTEHATHFINPLTFRSLTGEKVAVGLFDDPSDPIHHISLAKEADVFLIAPCTANVVAKMAAGIADDILTTTALACTCPIVIAPAMNVNMYENAATKANLDTLLARGVHIIKADDGYLACGDTGRGKLAPIEDIVNDTLCVLRECLFDKLNGDNITCVRDLSGKKVIITAGPTIESIDAVRYISNRSSGKMGYAIAEAAFARGAEVVLISGPVSLDAPSGVKVVYIESAEDMLRAVMADFDDADIAVFTAAVCDMRPANQYNRKLKKGLDDEMLESINMVLNPDVLKIAASKKSANQVVVGFAAETDDVIKNAKDKLVSKHADIIVANDVSNGGAFGKDTNKVLFVSNDETRELPEMSKSRIADLLLDEALKSL